MSELERALRRLGSDKRRQTLRSRPQAELPFLGGGFPRPSSFLYDTTVYVDILQGRFPGAAESMLRSTDAWHSAVAEGELASLCALLDPAHPNTPAVVKELSAVVSQMPSHRHISPDRAIWRHASILTGTVARLQKLPKADRRRILNDALIFSSARKHGHTVLTRNVVDFDFLQQLDPSGRVAFYRVSDSDFS
jgi:predicted nucleic acid-binding protein